MSENNSTTGANSAQQRPEKPKSKVGLIVGILVGVAALIVAAVFAVPALLGGNGNSNGNGADSTADAQDGAADGDVEERVSVKLGVNDSGKTFWNLLVQKAAEEGIDVEIVAFTDYNTPNPALAAGDIDINKFQHVRYLAQFNASNTEQLAPLGATEIYPITIYSTKWSNLDEVPEGAEVVLSNNPANQVRPLLALEAAGLIALKGDPGWAATLDDVDYANSKIGKITPIDPTLTASALDSVDLAFVDTPYAHAAGLTDENKVYFEDPDRDDLGQYINIFAVRAGDETNPAYLKIVEIYQSEELREAINKEDGGFDGIFKTNSVDELKEFLAEQVAEAKAGN